MNCEALQDRQLSTRLGEEMTPTHFLTHNAWNSMPEYFSRGSNETGVRLIRGGEVVNGSFELIQHGWYDWRFAGEIIKRLLAKGKTPRQISDIMDYMKDRRWVNQPPKARSI
jgi:hypothetical protein